MLYTLRKRGAFSLDPQELQDVLLHLPSDRSQPAILGQRQYLLSLAGLPAGTNVDLRPRRTGRLARGREGLPGDIVFKGDILLYVIIGGEHIVMDSSGRVVRLDRELQIEIGAVGKDAARLEAELAAFGQELEKAVRATFDGRRVRHMDFSWRDLPPERRKLGRVLRPEGEDAPAFVKAELDDAQVKAAQVLADASARELLRIISEAVFARQKELFERRSRKQDELRETLQALQESRTIATEYLLECKRTGTRLSRFADSSELNDDRVGRLVCASCGSAFKDEVLHEGYSLSDLGRRLVRGSHWMTVWLTELLVKLGMPADGIVWNVSEAGEEVDIITDFLDQLWVFELKDREFGAGDAHPFNYRRVRYGADRAIIVSADRVSKDAKRVFEELARDDPMGRRTAIVYIEGLENAEAILQREMSGAAIAYARQRLSILSDMAGYDLARVYRVRCVNNGPQGS